MVLFYILDVYPVVLAHKSMYGRIFEKLMTRMRQRIRTRQCPDCIQALWVKMNRELEALRAQGQQQHRTHASLLFKPTTR